MTSPIRLTGRVEPAGLAFRLAQRAQGRMLGLSRLDAFAFRNGSKTGPDWVSVPEEDLSVLLEGEAAE